MMNLKLALYIFLIASFNTGWASTFTVKKIKGRQAIIETVAPLEEGTTYSIESSPITLEPSSSKILPRSNSLQLSAGLQFISGSSVRDNRMDITGRYGWNYGTFEIGPTLRYQSTDLGAGADSYIYVGGFADYNLIKNKAPQDLIWGGTTDVELGSMQFKAGGSAAVLNMNFGGFATWFLAKSNAALRLQGLYGLQKVSTTTSETTLSGFFSKVFLVFYF